MNDIFYIAKYLHLSFQLRNSIWRSEAPFIISAHTFRWAVLQPRDSEITNTTTDERRTMALFLSQEKDSIKDFPKISSARNKAR